MHWWHQENSSIKSAISKLHSTAETALAVSVSVQGNAHWVLTLRTMRCVFQWRQRLMLSAEHKHKFDAGDECTICGTAGTQRHNLLMGSITLFLSDFNQICLVTWGIQKQKISSCIIISITKATENTWEVTPCLFSNLNGLSYGTLRLCNSETEIPKWMANVNESTAEVANRICYGIPNTRRKRPTCIVRKPLVY